MIDLELICQYYITATQTKFTRDQALVSYYSMSDYFQVVVRKRDLIFKTIENRRIYYQKIRHNLLGTVEDRCKEQGSETVYEISMEFSYLLA